MVFCYSSWSWQRHGLGFRHGWLQEFRAVTTVLFLSPSISLLLILSQRHSQESLCVGETKLAPRFRLEGQPRWRSLHLSQSSQQSPITSHWLWWGPVPTREPISVVGECDMRIAFGLGHTLHPDSVGIAPTGRRLNGVGAVDAEYTKSTSHPKRLVEPGWGPSQVSKTRP